MKGLPYSEDLITMHEETGRHVAAELMREANRAYFSQNAMPMDGDLCDSIYAASPVEESMRFNEGKPQLSMVLSAKPALEGAARVMMFGAEKYERDNWKLGLEPTTILDSMLRHITKYLDGEYIDDESGLPHIDHITCNALFLGYHTDRETQDGRDS